MHERFSRDEKRRNLIGSALVAVGSVLLAAFSWPPDTALELFAYVGGAVVFGGIAISFAWSLRRE